MLVQNSPFRELDSLFNQAFGTNQRAAWATGRPMPMDAYRRGDNVWVHLDLPGVSADSVDISVERTVLTVTAERTYQREEGDRVYFDERPEGTFRRQVTLGEGLDADGVEADYTDGVLTLRIPVIPQAPPRQISVGTGQRAEAIDPSRADAGGPPHPPHPPHPPPTPVCVAIPVVRTTRIATQTALGGNRWMARRVDIRMELSDALDFIRDKRNGVLIALKSDGRPQSSNVAFAVGDDDVIRISVTDGRAKTANLRRDPRASLHVNRDDFWAYAVIEADVTLMPVAQSPDDATVDALVDYYRIVAGEHDNWDEYRQAMVDDHRLILELHPARAYGMLNR